MHEHLIGCVAAGTCPSPTAHRRLDEVHTFWHRCLDNYQDPNLFRTDLNAGIQALRNVTFTLQKEMRHIEGFAEWYEPWRKAMGRTPVLRWLIEARNRIVKEGDLIAESTIRGRLVFDYFDAEAIALERAYESALAPIELKPEVLATLDEIREDINQRGIPEAMLADGIVVLERRWVAEGFPTSELLNVLAYAFSLLSSLVIDADVQFSATQHDPDLDPETIGTERSSYPAALRPPCMTSTHYARTACVRYLDGDSAVGGIASAIVFDPERAKQALDKYGPSVPVVGARSALDYVEQYALQGKRILASGEDHGWFHFYYRGPRLIHAEVIAARDKADKYALAQHVADLAIRLDADGVLQIAEVWLGIVPAAGEEYVPASDQPDRKEALQVYAEIASGETRGMLVPFSRSAFGVVSIDQRFDENHSSNFFLPVRAAWRAGRREGAPEARS